MNSIATTDATGDVLTITMTMIWLLTFGTAVELSEQANEEAEGAERWLDWSILSTPDYVQARGISSLCNVSGEHGESRGGGRAGRKNI